MSAVVDQLIEARKLIKRGWTQDADERNAAGDDISEIDWAMADIEPVCWCAGGAIFRAKPHPSYTSYTSAAAVFKAANGIEGIIPEWNDAPERTKAEVLAAFDKAIELARAEAK